MTVALHSGVIDKDGKVRVHHTFYGETETMARRTMENHAAGCAVFGPALENGHTIEVLNEIDEMPTEETFPEFTFVDEEDEDDDEPDEGEEEEEPEGVE
jgi:hypothetical protein